MIILYGELLSLFIFNNILHFNVTELFYKVYFRLLFHKEAIHRLLSNIWNKTVSSKTKDSWSPGTNLLQSIAYKGKKVNNIFMLLIFFKQSLTDA